MKELIPTNGRKSFYSKAMIDTTNEGEVLVSYGTRIILKKRNGEQIPLANPYVISNTTATHIKSFCGITKPQYVKLYKQYNNV